MAKAAIAAASVSLVLTGCGTVQSASVNAPHTLAGTHFGGAVHGGQQPIVGASIKLYAASTSGYGAANTNVLNTTVVTGAGGIFSFPSSAYTCVPGQQMYLTATGGDPGAGTNANVAAIVALGDCAGLDALPLLNVNEVTTVGTVFALAPFMSSSNAVGTSSTNVAGLVRAFASVNKLVNIGQGSSTGSALPANAVGPSSEINSLADSLAPCINSTGGVAGDNATACGSLFQLATPPGGLAPTDTIQAALNIAQNPTLNTAAIYILATPASPFQPQLASAPADWTMSVKYKNVGLSTPRSATVDGSGQVWFANSSSSTVTVLAQSGVPIAASPLSGNGLSGPAAVAVDTNGNAWVANTSGNSVSVFTASGSASASYTAAGSLNGPTALAFDAPGNLWIASSTGNSLTELNSNGVLLTQVTSGISNPNAVAINPK